MFENDTHIKNFLYGPSLNPKTYNQKLQILLKNHTPLSMVFAIIELQSEVKRLRNQLKRIKKS